MAKNNPASPRVVRRGTARPAEKSFHSASLETKHRNSTTIRRAGQSRIAFRSVPRDADDCNSTVPSCVFLPQNTQNPASPDTEGGWEKMPSRCFNHNPVTGDALRRVLPPQSASPPTRGHNTKGRDALRRVHVHSSHKSGIGPTRDVPAPPSARGVRTREVATCYDRPGDRLTPNMKSTPASGRLTRSRAETRGHGGFLELVYAHLNYAACNLHGLVANPGCDKRSPPVSSQNSTDSPIYGGARLSRPQSRWFCKCLCMVKRGRIVRSTFFPSLFCVARRAFLCILW